MRFPLLVVAVLLIVTAHARSYTNCSSFHENNPHPGCIYSPAGSGTGLNDHAIAASSALYLDGTWKAEATLYSKRVANCNFEDNVDFNHGHMGPNLHVANKVPIQHPAMLDDLP
jgi:hypothetical protein